MAIHGQKGSVLQWNGSKFVKILETTGWTLNITQQTAEAAVQEEEYVTRAAGAKDWNASIEGLAQTTRAEGNLVNFMVPENAMKVAPGEIMIRLRNSKNAADYVYEGKGVFTDLAVSSPEGGLVTVSATLAGVDIATYSNLGAPRNVSATSTHNSVTLKWEAPADVGDKTLTGFQRRHRLSTSNSFGNKISISGASTKRVKVSGLTADKIYIFELKATYSDGSESAPVFVTINTKAAL